ncbi:RNA polymerase sigma factor [Mucilaginibacter sp. SG564]|uniref:RNA polymerase sigma factor n=1 Tax=Mucilaginibacter sp. SG564 TaxID=2587022 RepID=UPI001551F8E3|nr:hypothetical protein [Mucilaginibacter sp. SG564]NOW96026.1 DNA-directed RNA polymerase specialized sigma24 family protein [Mucilaginibacter sp. SG564]
MIPFDANHDKRQDAALADLICKGSPEALQIFLSVHQQFIYNLSLRMLNDFAIACSLTQQFMVKLLLNMGTAIDNEDFTVWVYRRLVNDIRKAAAAQSTVAGNFEALGETLERQSYHPRLNKAEQIYYHREIEAVTNRCLSTMAACLPIERRFAFLLAGVFGVPVPIVSMILDTSESNVTAELAFAQQDLEEFTKGHCSLFGRENACTCDKRVNYFFDQDETVEFFNDNLNSKRKKISQLIAVKKNNQNLAGDDIVAMYRNQPFLEPHSSSDGVNQLCKRPEIIKDQYFN